MAALVAALTPMTASATECRDPFEFGVPVVEGRVLSVRQVERRVPFWGVDIWQADVATLRILAGKSAPKRFKYIAIDREGPCNWGFIIPKVGDVFAFPLYEDEWGKTPRTYSTNTAVTVARYRRAHAWPPN